MGAASEAIGTWAEAIGAWAKAIVDAWLYRWCKTTAPRDLNTEPASLTVANKRIRFGMRLASPGGMKTKIIAVALLLATSMVASARVVVGVGIGYPGYYVATPPPVVTYAAPVAPYQGPGYTWVGGYWYPVGARYYWHAGYWARPPYARAYWVAPHYYGHTWYRGYWHR
jgi:WXXGXW repeat (2 copies)